MTKYNFSLLFSVLFLYFAQAQQLQFEPVKPAPPAPQILLSLCKLYPGVVAIADINGDNANDIFIEGDAVSNYISKIYMNDGNNYFYELTELPFPGIYKGTVDFVDVDNDNDLDLFLTGYSSEGRIARLYFNDGSGNFTEAQNSQFEGVDLSSVAIADIDNDNDLDILITGTSTQGGYPSTKLYINDGTGNFAEVNTPFPDITSGSIAFSDVDNDNDPDLLLTGSDMAKLYINDGSGNFTEQSNTPFPDASDTKILFIDIDADNDFDVFMTGSVNYEHFVKLFINDGTGNFTEMLNTAFDNLSFVSYNFADIDNDNDPDILIAFTNPQTGNKEINFYINDGSGNFSVQPTAIFPDSCCASFYFGDLDNDNDVDLIVVGKEVSSNAKFTYVYGNDGSGNFEKIVGGTFQGVAKGEADFADIDADGDPDLLIAGQYGVFSLTPGYTNLYLNDASGNFSPVNGTPFYAVNDASVKFFDADNDNDQDLFIGGTLSNLFLNDGSGNFALGFDFTTSGKADFADVDNDGDTDVLITGYQHTKLFLNDGNALFTEQTSYPLPWVEDGSVNFADVDADDDMDVLITGSSLGPLITNLYLNDGFGFFEKKYDELFHEVSFGDVAFEDVDDDHDIDVLISGGLLAGTSILYLNDGTGNFTEMPNTPFPGVFYSSVNFTDIDGDNDPDLLISGFDSSSNKEATKLYLNDNGNFTEYPDLPFFNLANSFITCSDIDGDNDLDVLLTGRGAEPCRNISILYRNITDIPPAIYIKSPYENQLLSPETNTLDIKFSVFGFTVANATADGHIRYSLDNASPVDKFDTTPLHVTGLTQGTHTVYMELVDNSGNPLSPSVYDEITFTVANYNTINSLNELQTALLGEYYQLNNEIFITAQQEYPSENSVIFAQDETAAIKLWVPESITTLNSSINDGITNIKGKLVNNNGIMQLNLMDNIVLTGNNQFQQPEAIDIIDFLTYPDQYVSKLIRIENLTIDRGDDYQFQYRHSYMISDGVFQLPLKVFFKSLENTAISTEIVNITGIASNDMSLAQIYPRNNADIEVVTSINNNQIKDLKIYPNPVKSGRKLFISSKSKTDKKIQIYNLSGQQILSTMLADEQPLDLSDISKGVYLLKINQATNLAYFKLIIQ